MVFTCSEGTGKVLDPVISHNFGVIMVISYVIHIFELYKFDDVGSCSNQWLLTVAAAITTTAPGLAKGCPKVLGLPPKEAQPCKGPTFRLISYTQCHANINQHMNVSNVSAIYIYIYIYYIYVCDFMCIYYVRR